MHGATVTATDATGVWSSKHRPLAVAVAVAVRGADPASTTRTLTLRTR